MGFHRTGLASIGTAAIMLGAQMLGMPGAIASPQPATEAATKQAVGDSAIILDTSSSLDTTDTVLSDGSYPHSGL